MKQKKKFITSYLESDLATILNEYISTLQSPEGAKFTVKHVDEGTLLVTCANQTFIINIMNKLDIN